jgi:hypothetical protein
MSRRASIQVGDRIYRGTFQELKSLGLSHQRVCRAFIQAREIDKARELLADCEQIFAANYGMRGAS